MLCKGVLCSVVCMACCVVVCVSYEVCRGYSCTSQRTFSPHAYAREVNSGSGDTCLVVVVVVVVFTY